MKVNKMMMVKVKTMMMTMVNDDVTGFVDTVLKTSGRGYLPVLCYDGDDDDDNAHDDGDNCNEEGCCDRVWWTLQ